MTTKKTQVIKGQVSNKDGSNPIEIIMKKHNIDKNIWYVDSFKIKDGKWNTAAKKREQELTWTRETDNNGNPVQMMVGKSKHFPEFMMAENKTYSIEITFKRKPIENDILESFKELVKRMPKVEKFGRRMNNSNNGIAAELTTFDAHIGKLADEMETGYRNYDTNIAIKDYIYTSQKNLDLITPHKPEKIFYILGQDLYHVDNMQAHTTHGSHSMDVDGRLPKVHKKVFTISRDNIANASKIAPVEVIWIPGNHDYIASYMLALALKAHFSNDPNITIDIGENPRKARLWGNLLVGWTHRIVGKHNVWSNELAQAFPELWGKSVFREWHHGDQHKKMVTKVTPVATAGGVVCRQITALSPVDRWHSDNVFTDAVPGGESFLWSKDEGVFANFMSWTGQYEKHRKKLVS